MFNEKGWYKTICRFIKRDIHWIIKLLQSKNFGGSNSGGNITFLNNQTCQAKITLVNINSNESLLYPFIVSVNKWGGICNTVDDPYHRICVPGKDKST